MFKLVMITVDFYQVIESRGTFSGSLSDIKAYLSRLNVQTIEVEAAIDDMRTKRNNVADFGVGFSGAPSFIFSASKPFPDLMEVA